MKKLVLVAAVMLCGWTLAKAEMRDVPRGPSQALATADYGGVNYSTITFPFSAAGINFSTVAIPTITGTTVRGVFVGLMFSSGSAGAYDFADVFDSTSADQCTSANTMIRLYNTNGSSTTWTSNVAGAASGFSGPPKPIRFRKGLMVRLSNAAYNLVTVLFSLDD